MNRIYDYMKISIKIFLVIVITIMLSGCFNDKKTIEKEKEDDGVKEEVSIKVTINGKEYSAKIYDNVAAKSLLNLLPLDFNMNDLNGNEKYIYLANTFPTEEESPKHIEAGDIMLYGNDCLVIFYKSFDTSYSYTRIGHIDNLSDLGDKSVHVKFEK